MNPYAVDLALQRRHQARGSGRVDVARDGLDGRDRCELGEDVLASNITGVQNQLDPIEGAEQVRANQPVGVGYQADHAPAHATAPGRVLPRSTCAPVRAPRLAGPTL
jgi:hypothetical protein